MVRTSLLGPEEGQECSQPRSGAVTGTSSEFSHLLQQATRPPPGWSGPTNWHSALNSTTISIGYKNSTWMVRTPPLGPEEGQEHSQLRSGAVTENWSEFSHLLQQATTPPEWSGPINWHPALSSIMASIGYKNSTWMVRIPLLGPEEV